MCNIGVSLELCIKEIIIKKEEKPTENVKNTLPVYLCDAYNADRYKLDMVEENIERVCRNVLISSLIFELSSYDYLLYLSGF